MDPAELKRQAADRVDALAGTLLEASHDVHAHPELCFEERYAHDRLTAVLEAEGLPVTRAAFELETAFEARAGSGGPVVAVCLEYDALPGVGHACGHNIIAAAGLGAGLAAACVAEAAGGTVVVLGTPAEEGGGGKVFMARRGAFDGVDAALMVHPANADRPAMDAIAIQQLWVRYHGRAAHAAAAPHKGRNALDAAVLGYVNVAALRQHIMPTERVHGIFTKAGDQANIVPELAEARWYVRSPRMETLEDLKARVYGCLEAGAAAAGCDMEPSWRDPAYADLVSNAAIVDLYRGNADRLGRRLLEPGEGPEIVASTDMGNVSHLVPTIHPMIGVSPPDVPIHSQEFARWAAAPEGDRAVLDGAKALAMTIVDLWTDPAALAAARAEFEAATRVPRERALGP